MSKRKQRGLTERQRRFVDEYILDGNATQAAIRAGFKESSAQEQGSRLLSNVMVALAIRRRRATLARRFEVSADRVVAEYVKLASARVTDFMSFGPRGITMFASDDIDGHHLDAVQEVTERIGKGGKRVVSVKLHSKSDALAALGKHLGLFVDRHEHDVGARLSDALTTIKARLSPGAQEELVRAIGHVMASAVAPAADEPTGEPNG